MAETRLAGVPQHQGARRRAGVVARDRLERVQDGAHRVVAPRVHAEPRRADQISAALAGGRLTTNLRLFSDRHDVQVVATLVNQAVLALIGVALGGMSVIMLLAHGSPAVARGISLLQLFGYAGLFLSVTLLLRVVLEVLRPRQP